MFKNHTEAKSGPDRWLHLISGSAVSRWTSQDGMHRVYLVSRNDGRFSSYSEYFSDHEFEHCWIEEHAAGSFYDSEETAVKEIYGVFPWSKDVKREDHP